MSDVSVEEWQLLSFFEVEPALLDPEEPWCYNDALYKVQQDSLFLSFAIAPAYHDVRIILECDGRNIYELNAVNAKDIRYTKDGGAEQLVIIVNETESILMMMKPNIVIRHTVENRP